MKHLNKFNLLNFFFLILLPIAVFGQTDSSKKINWKSFLGKNLNPGISMGIGGARPYGIIPQLTLKLGRFEFEMSPLYSFKGKEYVYSAHLGMEFNKMNGYNNKPITLVASVGAFIKGYNTSLFGFDERNNIAFLAGINQQLTNRSRISLKIGALHSFNYSTDPNSYYYNYNGKWYPFGEISYRLYALPFGDRGFFSLKKAVSDLKQTDKETICSFFSKYFNPRISFGLGVTHPAFFGPTVGVKISRLDLGLGIFHLGGELWVSLAGDVDIIKILKKNKYPTWLTLGASLMASYDAISSYHAGFKKYYKHGSLSIKSGIGVIYHYDDWYGPNYSPKPNSIIPTLDISYSLYLFKFRN